MIKAIFAAAILLAQAAPVAAQTATSSAAATPVGSPKDISGVTVTGKKTTTRTLDPNEIICHKEQVLGTLFPKEVCARREDLAERRRTDQASTRESQALRPWKDEATAK